MTNQLLYSAVAAEAMSTLELDRVKITFMDWLAIRHYIVSVAYPTDGIIFFIRCLLFNLFLNFGTCLLELLLEFQYQGLSHRVGFDRWCAISLNYLRI